MIEPGFNPRLKTSNLNQIFRDTLKGSLDDKTLKISLAKFLRQNLGFTFWLLTGGMELAPMQEMILRAWFTSNFSLNVMSRAAGKSFLYAAFCFLYPLFYPSSKILIVSANFRSARRVFEKVEEFVNMPNAVLLKQCFPHVASHRNDQFIWNDLNGGQLVSVPLSNGSGLRGLRANVLGIDEFLLLSKETIEEILKPFLAAKQDVQETMKLQAYEDKLIEGGAMTEDQRISDESSAKIIGLTSASFKFEYCYTVYKQYIETIMKNEKKKARYFVSQIGWEMVPKAILDKSVIHEAKNGGASNSAFLREYGAQFTDDSEGYFSAKKMQECTITDGEQPVAQIVGHRGSKYLLSIDPSFSGADDSDFFAMSVWLLNEEEQTITLVHTYGTAGNDLKNHIQYFNFLITRFNIVFIIIDATGSCATFLDSVNESQVFKEQKIEIQDMELNFDCEGQDYDQEILKLRRTYRLIDKKILYGQVFSSSSVRKMNEYLQARIDNKKVWFSSKIAPNESVLKNYMELDIPDLTFRPTGDEKDKFAKLDFIEQQDRWIEETKRQISLIEAKSSPQGGQTFNLPSHLTNSRSKNRARKDHYSAALMANWGSKIYFDMNSKPLNNHMTTFLPMNIG